MRWTRSSKIPKLHDNPVLPGKNSYGDPNEENKYNTNLPEVHDVLKGLRKIADEYNAVLIGETWTKNIEQLKQYYGEPQQRIADADGPDVHQRRQAVAAGVSPADRRGRLRRQAGRFIVISNHDIVRSYDRYGDGKHNDAIAKVMAGLYLTLRGTPIMYYGEEIGMEQNDPKSQRGREGSHRTNWAGPTKKGRDGERTPMQWRPIRSMPDSARRGRGCRFPTTIELTMSPANRRIPIRFCVSMSSYWRCGTRTRRCSMAITSRSTRTIPTSCPICAAIRIRRCWSCSTCPTKPQKASFDLAPQGFSASEAKTLLTTMPEMKDSANVSGMTLAPFAVYIGEVTRAAK